MWGLLQYEKHTPCKIKPIVVKSHLSLKEMYVKETYIAVINYTLVPTSEIFFKYCKKKTKYTTYQNLQKFLK